MNITTARTTATTPMRPRLRACLLVRQSTVPDEITCFIKDQRDRGMAFIQAHGWVIDPDKDVLVQVVSGWKKSANREKIAELVDLTTAGQYDVVVLLSLDRFGRRVPEVTTYYDAMAEANVLLASVTEGIYDLTIPTQLAFAHMMIVHAQLESGKTSASVTE